MNAMTSRMADDSKGKTNLQSTIDLSEEAQVSSLNKQGFAIIRTSRISDLGLSGRQDIRDISLRPSLFGEDYQKYSVVLKHENPNSICNFLQLFPSEKHEKISGYLSRGLFENPITEQLRTSSESEA